MVASKRKWALSYLIKIKKDAFFMHHSDLLIIFA